MSSAGEAACSYAALILYDDGIPITCNIEDLITNVGAAGAGAAVAAAAPVAAGAGGGAAAPPPAEEKKKEEPEEESDDDMGFSLFD
uniref:60S acidic ribosomal protein P1-like n=1 Tax=Gossypium raimondii TaxID=29730 RepID=A0A0D2TDA1_GOSRA|nr:hypothetical protein B456_007G112800 [Gossypium raimondii]